MFISALSNIYVKIWEMFSVHLYRYLRYKDTPSM